MCTWTRILARGLPALFMMFLIFSFSAQPSSELPSFDWADRIVKKGGHMAGYALLALAYWWMFDFRKERRRIAWLLAVVYAVTDEFHQSFVPGRHPSLMDVLLFDNVGAWMSLWLANLYRKQKRPDIVRPVVDEIVH